MASRSWIRSSIWVLVQTPDDRDYLRVLMRDVWYDDNQKLLDLIDAAYKLIPEDSDVMGIIEKRVNHIGRY